MRAGEIGQRGEEEPSLETGLPGYVHKGQVLHDEPVRLHLPGQPVDEAVGGRRFAGFDQRIHGHIDAGLFAVGKVGQTGELGQAEVLRLHTGGKMLEAQIDGVGSGGKARQEGGRIAGRGQDLGALRRGQGEVMHSYNIP